MAKAKMAPPQEAREQMTKVRSIDSMVAVALRKVCAMPAHGVGCCMWLPRMICKSRALAGCSVLERVSVSMGVTLVEGDDVG